MENIFSSIFYFISADYTRYLTILLITKFPHNMIKQFLTLFLLALLFSQAGQGQKLKRNDDILLFKEAKTKQPVIIVNDSLAYKNGKSIPFFHTNYPDNLSEYIPFEIGEKTYLVYEGCGPVLEFRNDSVVRVDKSYPHKNQYHSIPFTYKNEIYLFGGYGLFTFKNIITRYDFKSGEWNQVRTKGDSLPEPRYKAFSYREKDDLYVFGGYTADNNNIPEAKPVHPTIWKLHLPTMTWTYLGNCNSTFNNFSKIQIKEKLYVFDHYITQLDFRSNNATKYNFINHELIHKHYVIGDTIFGIFSNGEEEFYFKKATINDLLGNRIDSSALIIYPNSSNLNYTKILVVLIVLLLLLVGYKKRMVLFSKPFNGIVFNTEKEEFLYKRKPITHFEENEKKALHFLLKNSDQFVSLNQLNELFENPNQPETQSAIFKRREQAINGLLTKVSKLTDIPEHELVLERKNTEDKRLKDVLLLPKLLKIV